MAKTKKRETFIDRCLKGTAKPSQIDAWIARWHRMKNGPLFLSSYLGLTDEEYMDFARGDTKIEDIVEARKKHILARTPSRTVILYRTDLMEVSQIELDNGQRLVRFATRMPNKMASYDVDQLSEALRKAIAWRNKSNKKKSR